MTNTLDGVQGRRAHCILSVQGLSKSFGGVRATSDVTFDVLEGDITALIGPNGAGKTTVFNLITNIFPYEGEVSFDGRNIKGLSPVQVAQIGLIRTFQSARVFPGMTVLENVLAGRHRLLKSSSLSQFIWGQSSRREEADLRRRAEGLLDLVGLLKERDTHAVDLPMGAQKLLEVVRALMSQPRLLCLDEPAAGLNDKETEDLAVLLKAVRASGVPILLVEHNMGLVMGVADQVLVLDAGAVIAWGPPAEIQQNETVIEAYLGREDHAAA
ncbi:MAG: ABC transporter ATP-binding protein [Candidimonas sp.]|nr:MAG: ABC transporter ATP-binding protein [Candidimonas sp.]TAM20979.1 MAG: ABC transporter ATP-binding protein [Candidimonas sp.]